MKYQVLPVLIALFALGALEMMAYYNFWLRYWQSGLTVFRRTYRYSRSQSITAVIEYLERGFPTYGVMQLRFRQIGDQEIAFVEQRKFFTFGFTYMPVIRGIIRIDPTSQTVEIGGRLMWYIVPAIAALAGMAVVLGDRQGLPFYVLVVALVLMTIVVFIAQRVLYNRIANSLRDLLQAWD